MTDQDLQNLYRQNLGQSESAALRGVFDAGYASGAGWSAAQAQSGVDQSTLAAIASVAPLDPTVVDPTN